MRTITRAPWTRSVLLGALLTLLPTFAYAGPPNLDGLEETLIGLALFIVLGSTVGLVSNIAAFVLTFRKTPMTSGTTLFCALVFGGDVIMGMTPMLFLSVSPYALALGAPPLIIGLLGFIRIGALRKASSNTPTTPTHTNHTT